MIYWLAESRIDYIGHGVSRNQTRKSVGRQIFCVRVMGMLSVDTYSAAHVIAALQNLPQLLPGKMRCRLLVRNVEHTLQTACDYFGVDVVDAKSFVNGL